MGCHQNQLGASNSTWYSRYGRPTFQFSCKIQGKGQQKSRFPAIFGTFWKLMHFCTHKHGLSPEPNRSLQLHLVLKIWPPEVSLFIRTSKEWETKIAFPLIFVCIMYARWGGSFGPYGAPQVQGACTAGAGACTAGAGGVHRRCMG